MSRLIKKGLVQIIILFIVMIAFSAKSQATLSIRPSKSSVAPGESFSVTVSVSGNEAGIANLTISNGTLSTSSVDLMSQSSVSITCTAGNSGTVSINASGLVANYETETEGTQSAVASITIVQPVTQTTTPSNNSTSSSSSSSSKKSSSNTTTTQTKSSNSRLATLQIAEGAISPEFNSSEKEYRISVPNEITTLSISAIADSSKATVNVSGNEELQVGENTIKVVVKAEDGSTTTYTIIATRAKEELNINALNIYYIDENGQKVVLNTNPEFIFNIYEYSLEKLPYTVKELNIEATSNKKNATIEITGNTELKDGKNQITVKATVIDEESGLEEQKIYTITVEREAEPVKENLTFIQKIKKWFGGAGITKWVSENLNNIIKGMLFIATLAFVGLTVYFAYDYKKYQGLLAKLAEYNKENLMERANIALKPEVVNFQESDESFDNFKQTEETMKEEIAEEIIDPETAEICAEIEEARAKIKRGKRYKE